MLQRFAYTISVVCHPLLVPSYLFLTLAYSYPYFETQPSNPIFPIVGLLTFITTFFIPILGIVWLVKWRVVSSVELEYKKERFYPMLLIGSFYIAINHTVFDKIPVDPTFDLMLDAIGGLIITTALITFFWKISAHAISSGGVVGFLLALSTNVTELELIDSLIGALLISGLVMSSRLHLKAHSPAQVYTGFTLGSLSGFIVTFWCI